MAQILKLFFLRFLLCWTQNDLREAIFTKIFSPFFGPLSSLNWPCSTLNFLPLSRGERLTSLTSHVSSFSQPFFRQEGKRNSCFVQRLKLGGKKKLDKPVDI